MIIELIIIIGASFFLSLYCSEPGLGYLTLLLDIPTFICIALLSLPLLFRKSMGKDFLRAIPMQFKKRYVLSRKEGKLILEKKNMVYSLAQMKRSLDAVEFMQKQILYSGTLIVIFSAIIMLSRLDDISISTLGPNVAVTLIAVFYTAALELLLLPLQIDIKRRIINYMEEE